ncbi:MAG TPA: endonuclease III domain-containing protein [Candidatus Omnitrophota bacterium]|nr:endonuclease III domain-containing protein [Candidatus Omnitrophota bacterium]
MPKVSSCILFKIYHILYQSFGPQQWWPGETTIEIMVGAILTQNTNWKNVEKAIENLKQEKALSVVALRQISIKKLAFLIKPAGYFNVKAARLKSFIDFLFFEYSGNLKKMGQERLPVLREKLLAVKGIGPETADSILLYAFEKPVFVVDTYTKRFLLRHHFIKEDASYYQVQEFFMSRLLPDVKMFNEFHALIVRLGKEYCKTKPLCGACPLKERGYFDVRKK